MSALAKKAVVITILVALPMIATNIVLLNLHKTGLLSNWYTLTGIGVALAIIIFCLLWVKTNINKD